MLKTALEEAARRLPGCEAAALVGRDGILVEQWTEGGGPSLEVLAAEMTPLLRAADVLAGNSDGGSVNEILLRLDSWSCLVRPINEEIFLVLVAARTAVPGRLRFEATRAAARLESELQ
jgi:predicted regulator of Ras-like GTPase activity (Roadblock/LC7/MglB family)